MRDYFTKQRVGERPVLTPPLLSMNGCLDISAEFFALVSMCKLDISAATILFVFFMCSRIEEKSRQEIAKDALNRNIVMGNYERNVINQT